MKATNRNIARVGMALFFVLMFVVETSDLVHVLRRPEDYPWGDNYGFFYSNFRYYLGAVVFSMIWHLTGCVLMIPRRTFKYGVVFFVLTLCMMAANAINIYYF